MDRQIVSSGAPWEPVVSYSRAVRAGDHVFVAGTTSAGPDGLPLGRDDPYLQAKHCIEVIAEALEACGATLADVVRTRIFVTDIAHWPEIGRAHGEAFAAVRPAATLVQVAALIDPALLVEIEADAIVGSGSLA